MSLAEKAEAFRFASRVRSNASTLIAIALLVAAVFIAAYPRLSPGVCFEDSGDLQLAAATLSATDYATLSRLEQCFRIVRLKFDELDAALTSVSEDVRQLARMGDTMDNVKGVPGIGEKGARDLISTFGSLDVLLEHAPELKQKKYREALQEHAQGARESTTGRSVPIFCTSRTA